MTIIGCLQSSQETKQRLFSENFNKKNVIRLGRKWEAPWVSPTKTPE